MDRVTRRRRFTGIAQFPSALPVGPDALGLSETVKIGEHNVALTLPQGNESGALIAPQRSGRPFPNVLHGALHGGWGYRSTPTLYYVQNAAASLLLTATDEVANSKEFRNLGEAFFRWFEIVRDWAEAWSGVPLGQVGQPRNSALHVATRDGRIAGTGIRLPAVFFGASPLTPEQVRAAFRRASRGERLPTEHRLIQSAQVAKFEGDLRRAVIDAGSAAEVALSSAIMTDLRRSRSISGFAERAVKDANGIMGLMNLYASLGHDPAVSKTKVRNELAEVRNLAAHTGYVPIVQEADLAIQHARDLVQGARPLPPI
jgi:hypothetical protein